MEIKQSNEMIDFTQFEELEIIDVDDFIWDFSRVMNKTSLNVYTAKNAPAFFSDECINIKFTLFHREVDILSKLNHPSILKFYGYSLAYIDSQNPAILMEYSSGYTLYDYIFKNDISKTQILIIIYGIASGVSYLHSHNILHRNLKPENILFDDLMRPKITGFANAIHITKSLSETESIKNSKYKGTLKYLAPEVLSKLEYSKFSDVYAFSLILYQMITKKNIYANDFDAKELINDKKQINNAYFNLIKRCLSQEPSLRPTFDEIVDELKNNPEYITDGIDKAKYYAYIKYLDESEITFDERKMQFNDILSLRSYKIENINYTNNYSDFNLSKYSIESLERNDIDHMNYTISSSDNENCQEKNKNKKCYCAQVYPKEISSFYKNEVINFYRKLNIISQINHPAILNFVGFSPVDFNHKMNPVVITERCCIRLDNDRIKLSSTMIESIESDNLPIDDETDKLLKQEIKHLEKFKSILTK